MSSPSQTDADIHCDVCGEPTRVAGYGQQYGTLEAHWGYGSNHDGQGNLRDVCNGAQLSEQVVFLKERRMKRLV